MADLGSPAGRQDAATLMALLDTNGDQGVSLQEFLDFHKKVRCLGAAHRVRGLLAQLPGARLLGLGGAALAARH
jgi:hypothetical protein